MSNLVPDHRGFCIPIRIGPKDRSDSGSRLGGRRPAGISPRHVTPLTQYFCTIRIAFDPVIEASLFISFDFDGMWDHAGSLQKPGPLYEVVVHEESVRSDDSEFISVLSSHSLLFETACEDVFTDDNGDRIVRSDHKIGGYPFIQNIDEGLPAAVEAAYQTGYFQVLQIDFPGAKDGPVKGNWPFAGGIVHLLACEPLEENSWLCFWEY